MSSAGPLAWWALSCPPQESLLGRVTGNRPQRHESLYRDPYKAVGPRSAARITGMQGVHLLQGRGRAGRENRELFQEGVEGRDTKIRPLVPKKTLAPSKALERGSPARNVTPGGAPRAWAVRSVRGTNGTARRPVVTGISPPPTPPAKFWSWFQLLPVCTQRTYGKARGNKPPSPSANGLHSSFFDCSFASSAFFLLHLGCVLGGAYWGVLRSDHLGAGAPGPGLGI